MYVHDVYKINVSYNLWLNVVQVDTHIFCLGEDEATQCLHVMAVDIDRYVMGTCLLANDHTCMCLLQRPFALQSMYWSACYFLRTVCHKINVKKG